MGDESLHSLRAEETGVCGIWGVSKFDQFARTADPASEGLRSATGDEGFEAGEGEDVDAYPEEHGVGSTSRVVD